MESLAVSRSVVVVVFFVVCVGCSGGSPGTSNNVNSNHVAVCGNGVVEGSEQCDGFELAGDTCESRGFGEGQLSCTVECLFDTSDCYTCGDGEISGPEACDGTTLGGLACEDLGYVGGDLACSAADCQLDTTGCHDCGNGVIDGSETCDGTNVAGQTCQLQTGFAQGELSCGATCLAFDTAGCHDCGNGAREGPEDCDGSDLGSATCLSEFGHTEGALSCRTDCTFDFGDCHTCGDDSIDGSELCDGSSVGAETCLNLTGLPDGALTCMPGCAAYDTSGCHTCGNGVLDGPETCEDGNTVDWDGCTDCFISEFQVNTFTTDYQFYPDVAVVEDGSFIVVWYSRPFLGIGQDGDGSGVFGQRFDDLGNPVGGEFQVNSYTTDDQEYPSVATAGSGGFVVVWRSYGQDGDGWGVFGQRFDSAGNPVGGEFQVNSYTTDDQEYPSVAMAADGSFMVVWESYGQDGVSDGVFARRFDNAGDPVGVELQVNSYTSGDQKYPEVAMAGSGEHVIVWQSWIQDGDDWGIFSQRFDSTGNPVGSEFQVNSCTVDSQRAPEVAMAADGRFVVVWQSRDQGEDQWGGIYAQRYDTLGCPVGGELHVNSYQTNNQKEPSVAMAADGGFVVVWHSYIDNGILLGLSWDVCRQRFDGAGNPLGGELQLNSYLLSQQNYQQVAMAGDGRHVVTWFSFGQDGDDWGVFAQRFDSDGNLLGVGP